MLDKCGYAGVILLTSQGNSISHDLFKAKLNTYVFTKYLLRLIKLLAKNKN